MWQHGSGAHSNELRHILSSTYPYHSYIFTDFGATLSFRHVMWDGYIQWVVAQVVTRSFDFVHVDGKLLNYIQSMTFVTDFQW